MDELVRMLSQGDHPVVASPGNKATWAGLRDRIDIGVVHVRFVETQTEVAVRLLRDACDFSLLDFENGAGQAHLVGTLTLNDVPVRCVADVSLPSLAGNGHLEPQELHTQPPRLAGRGASA